MVAGHLREKNGIWQMVLELRTSDGKRKTISRSTNLPVKGNKKKAEQMLLELRKQFSNTKPKIENDILFSDFLIKWLSIVKDNLQESTYSSYYFNIFTRIVPFFQERGTYLREIKPTDIEAYYVHLKNTYHVKNTTIIRHHANIRKALDYAVKNEWLLYNPADKVERPKAERFVGNVYTEEDIKQLFQVIQDDPIELAVILAACYGLRREEVLGLKWKAIDFSQETITIEHTVIGCTIDGELRTIAKDSTKTKASYRTLPLIKPLKELLEQQREKQKTFQKAYRSEYNWENEEYVNVDKKGNLLKPNYITQHFHRILKKHNLKPIRFHDLRHTCASLLYANDVDMKKIQEWLGHSSISTTMNIYTHLSYQEKQESAEVIDGILKNTFVPPLNVTKK